MKNLRRGPSLLRNQKGMLTLDFIFALLMMFAFSAILFAFSMTFTAVEVAQYATFASARAYFAAHASESKQQDRGTAKFNALVRDRNSMLSMFFRNGWFEIGDVQLDDFNDEYPGDPETKTFVGAKTSITAKILEMRFPLLGSTSSDQMSAELNAFLMREPNEDECARFVQQRFQRIQQLKAGFASPTVNAGAYAVIMDDGC